MTHCGIYVPYTSQYEAKLLTIVKYIKLLLVSTLSKDVLIQLSNLETLNNYSHKHPSQFMNSCYYFLQMGEGDRRQEPSSVGRGVGRDVPSGLQGPSGPGRIRPHRHPGP